MLVPVLFALCSAVVADSYGLSKAESHIEECKRVVGVCSLGKLCAPAKFRNSNVSDGKYYIQ